MSLLDRIEAADEDVFAPGTSRIRAGSEHGLSLAERLSYRLHRLAWRTPFHRLRLRGRPPLQLLTVPKDPIAGDKAAGEAILAGRIVFDGRAAATDTLDFADPARDAAFADHLQSFAWLRDLAAAATRERAAATAEALVRRWLEQSGRIDERGWRADLWGRRTLFWSAYAPYILSSRDPAYRAAVLGALARGSRHLDRAADKAPPGLPRIAAWCGLIASALVVQGGPARLGRGERGLSRALAEALHDDGGLVSRAPAEQVDLVELLGQLRAVYYAARQPLPDDPADALRRAASALLSATLGDGALGNWQGGTMLSRRRVEGAVDAAATPVRPLRQARGWGYQRLAAKGIVVVLDAAPPPPSRAIRGGCASTLAFEMSDGGARLVVNCGGARASAGGLPAEILQALRSTAAHSTLTLGDRNSTAVLPDGTLGKGVSEVELTLDEAGGAPRADATHDGYARRFGLVHRRRLELAANGLELVGEDSLERRGRRWRSDAGGFAIRFHLGPAVEVTSTADGQGALLRMRGGAVWQFRCRGGALASEESLWIDGAGRPHATRQLVVSGDVGAEGASVAWTLRRAG